MSRTHSTDPRIQRTRASLQEALLTLCKKRDPDSVTVSEIAEAASVNRTTFYQHYPDVNTLLADALDAVADAAHAQLELQLPTLEQTGPGDIIARYLQHVFENAALYRKVLGASGSPILVARLTDRVSSIAEAGMRAKNFDESEIPIPVAAASIAGSFVGIVRAWLSMKPMPHPEIATGWALATLAPIEAAAVSRAELPERRA
jgi:AcrR family transcriptional regulator